MQYKNSDDIFLKLLLAFSLPLFLRAQQQQNQPNIIFILADDQGWNDVSYNGMNEILTPNIDTLAGAGLLLNNYYVQPLCSPSRASLLTGRYAIYTGLSHLPFTEGQPFGLSLNFTLFPEHMRDLGYQTHMLGKWHLGFPKKEYTPTLRGFDTHYGYWGGVVDYFQHTSTASKKSSDVINLPSNYGNNTVFFVGYDFHDDLRPIQDDTNRYLVDLLSDRAIKIIKNHNRKKPLFMYLAQIAVHAPPDDVPQISPNFYKSRYNYINDTLRKNFAGHLTALDDCVGNVIEALYETNMLTNTIVIYSSDNGADRAFFPNGGSCYPLRGSKGSVFEGGIKVPGFIWSPLIPNLPRVSNDLMHITDWLPTVYQTAGGKVSDLKNIDGISQWPMIFEGKSEIRKNILINIDNVANISAYREGDFKIISGYDQSTDKIFGPSGRDPSNQSAKVPLNNKVQRVLRRFYNTPTKTWKPKVSALNCGPPPTLPSIQCVDSPCLFNTAQDPCEHNDISASNPTKTQELLQKMNSYRKDVVPPFPGYLDFNSSPLKHCALWTTFLDPDQNNLDCCGRF